MLSWYQHIRAGETLILLGIPVIGVLSCKNEIKNIADILPIMLSFFLVETHVYMFNDWANASHDRFDIKRSNTLLIRKPELATLYLLISICMLFAGCAIALFVSFNTFIAGIFIFIASFLYSSKKISLKEVPVLSSFIHVIAGTLYFLYGYLLYGDWDLKGVLIGLYFGMVYGAGHLNHEVKDHEADRMAGIKTSAVKYGPVRILYISFMLMTLSNFYCIVLAVNGIMPWKIALLPVIGYPLYAFFFLQIDKLKPRFENIIRFRNKYRILYMIIGAVWIFVLLF